MDDPKIQIARGETGPIEFSIVDNQGIPVDVSSATRVRFAISPTKRGPVLHLIDSYSDEEIVVEGNVVSVYLTEEISSTLPIGKLYADIWFYIDSRWSRIDKTIIFSVVEGIGEP